MFQISDSELRAYHNEMLIMLGLGGCMFTGLNFSQTAHAHFKTAMAEKISQQIHGGHVESRIREIEKAFDLYLEDLIDRERAPELFTEFSSKYLRRVFPANPKVGAMFMQVNIAKIPLDLALESFRLVRDGYGKLKHGVG